MAGSNCFLAAAALPIRYFDYHRDLLEVGYHQIEYSAAFPIDCFEAECSPIVGWAGVEVDCFPIDYFVVDLRPTGCLVVADFPTCWVGCYLARIDWGLVECLFR